MGTKKISPQEDTADDQPSTVGAFDIIQTKNKKDTYLRHQVSFADLLDGLNKYCGRYLKLNIYSKHFVLNQNQFVIEHVVQKRKRTTSNDKLTAMAYMSYKISLNENADFLDIIIDDLVIIGDIKQEHYGKILQYVKSIELFKIINLQNNLNVLPKKYSFYHSINLKNFISHYLEQNKFTHKFETNDFSVAIENDDIILEIHQSRANRSHTLNQSDINFDLRSIEIQEYSEAFSKIDSFFQNNKITECSQEIFRALLKHNNNRLILSYLSMVMIFQRTDQQHLNILISGINHFPTENIMLSALLKHYFNTNKPNQIIDTLEKITSNITNIEPKKPSLLASFLPEVLGDLWAAIDLDQALVCYKKSLQVEPGHPRILSKLIALAEKQQRFDDQLDYLKQMIAIERRQPHLADQLMKASKIYHKQNQPKQAIEYAAKGFKLSPNSIKAATLLADLYNETKQYEKSVVVIDMFIKNNKHELSKNDQSKLQLTLARIWLNQLSRPDIAIIHLDRSIELNEENSEAMMLLASIYREQGNHTELVKTLNMQLQIYRKQKRDHEATSIIQELASIYKNHLNQSHDAWVLYQATLLGERIDNEVFEKYLTNDTSGVDWVDVEQKLKAQIINDKDSKQKFETLLLLYKVQKNHIQDTDGAYNSLLKACEIGKIDKQHFNQLCNHLIKNNKFKKTSELLKDRIETVSNYEKSHLIEKLIKIPESENAYEKDEYIIKLLKTDNTKDYPLFDRLTHYASKNDEEAFESLLKQIKRIQTDKSITFAWLNAVNQIIFEYEFNFKFRMLEKNFQFMWSITDDKISLAKAAVNFLSNSEDLNQLRKYVIYLLEENVTPTLEQEKIEQIIGPDPDLKFSYLYPLCFNEDKKRVTNIRKTIQLLSKLQDKKPEIKISLLYELSKETCLSDDELDTLNRYMANHQKWNEISQLLKNQIMHAKNDEKKHTLLLEYSLFLAQKFNKFEQSFNVIKKSFESSTTKNKEKSIKTALRLIKNHPSNTHIKAILSLIWDYFEYLDNPIDTRNFFQTASDKKVSLPGLIDKLSKNKDQDGTYDTLKDVWNQGYQDYDTARYILNLAITKKIKSDIIFYWLRSVELIKNQFSLEEHIRETMNKIKDHDTVDEMDLIDAFLSHPNTIDSKSIIEILLPIALKNFRAEKEPIRTYRYFQKVLEFDAYNTEAIIPYYFLLLDYGTIENKINFSKKLMDLLAKNPDLLNDYPLTIESIERKYKKLINIKKAQHSNSSLHADDGKITNNPQNTNIVDDLPNQSTVVHSDENPNNQTMIGSNIDLESTEFSPDVEAPINNNPVLTAPLSPKASELTLTDWRMSITGNPLSSNDLETILNSLYKASEIEQCLGIQVVSLLSGNPEMLNKSPLKPWLKNEETKAFEHNRENRKQRNASYKYKKTAFVNLIQNLGPMITNIFDSKFSKKYLIRKLNLSEEMFLKKVNFLDIDSPKLAPLNLMSYALRFKALDFKLCHFNGLNHHTFFDYSNKALYFDMEYYFENDINKLRYIILYNYFLNKNNFYVIMSLDFDKDLKGFITALRTYVKDGKIVGVKNKDKIRNAFKEFSRQKLNPYMPVLTSVTRNSLTDIKTKINNSIYQEILIENLDVLSIAKIILNVDPLANLQVYRNLIEDESIMALLKAATQLDLSDK